MMTTIETNGPDTRPVYGSRCLGCEGCDGPCRMIFELFALPWTLTKPVRAMSSGEEATRDG